MDAIRVDGREASLDSNLLRVVAALRANLGSLHPAVDQRLNIAQAEERYAGVRQGEESRILLYA